MNDLLEDGRNKKCNVIVEEIKCTFFHLALMIIHLVYTQNHFLTFLSGVKNNISSENLALN